VLKQNKLALFVVALALGVSTTAAAAGQVRYAKLDGELNDRAAHAPAADTTSVILRVKGPLPAEFKKYARPGTLTLINAYVLDVPNSQLKAIGSNASTQYATINATVHAFNFRTGVSSGAYFARQMMGINGAGVGVAVLDSGVAPNNETPVKLFRDFLVPDAAHAATDTHCYTPCDPNGHGTHVAGTIAGNGANSYGEKAGMAPGASLFALRVLGADGTGQVDGVVNALQWILDHHSEKNIRIVNLSFGMKPSGSLPDADPLATMLDPIHGDPLAIMTKALVDAGVFVVAAAGNVGQVDCSTLPTATSHHAHAATGSCDVWGGITEPGTFPWVFTAGASSSNGTFIREDDARAKFSSRGPAFPLQIAKPDLLAGGVGIESTAVAGSTLYKQGAAASPPWLVAGAFPTPHLPYMVLTGTSQAAAVVSGVAAQMLQANPNLTPNLIKAILEYTSQDYAGNGPLEEGAGFLNALGAVRLSRFYATAKKGQRVPVEPIWSKHFIWGNHEMSGGLMLPKSNAWKAGVLWGTPKTAGDDGDNIVWGTSCGSDDCGDNIVWGTANDGDNIVWGTADGDNIVWGTSGDGDNIVWGTADDGDNIVWGTACSGADCDNIVWGTATDGDNIVWGTAADGDNIVWGTDDGDNIVWGTADGDNIVWGTDDGDNIVWGTADGDNIVWGTADGDNIVWGTADDGDNIVWGTADDGDNIVWGTADGDNIVWGTFGDGDNIVWGTDGDNIVWGTSIVGPLPSTQLQWYALFLNRHFDAFWIAHEFGDSFSAANGRGTLKSPKVLRPRRLPKSHQK
jgi:subtilisin family serine protease